MGMRPIDEYKGASVWMKYQQPPVVVVRWRMSQENGDALAVHGLVHALGGAGKVERRPDGWMQAEITYDGELDETLRHLIDLLITLRYAHPTMVQLPLALGEDEAKALAEALNG